MDRDIPPGAHALLITPSGEIVLEQKTPDYAFNPGNSNNMSMYGGGIEKDEAPAQALRRELKEELGFDMPEEPMRELHVYTKDEVLDGSRANVHVFVIKDIDVTGLSARLPRNGEGSMPFVIDTAENFLHNPRVTRITKLALGDYQKSLGL